MPYISTAGHMSTGTEGVFHEHHSYRCHHHKQQSPTCVVCMQRIFFEYAERPHWSCHTRRSDTVTSACIGSRRYQRRRSHRHGERAWWCTGWAGAHQSHHRLPEQRGQSPCRSVCRPPTPGGSHHTPSRSRHQMGGRHHPLMLSL